MWNENIPIYVYFQVFIFTTDFCKISHTCKLAACYDIMLYSAIKKPLVIAQICDNTCKGQDQQARKVLKVSLLSSN